MLEIFNGYPGTSDAEVDVGGFQPFGLHRFKGLHVSLQQFGIFFGLLFGIEQLIPHLSAQVFLAQFPAFIIIAVVFLRIEIDAIPKLIDKFICRFARQLFHIRQINLHILVQRYFKSFLGCFGMGGTAIGLDGGLKENGGLVPCFFILALILNGTEQRELVVIGEYGDVGLVIDGTALSYKAVVNLIQSFLRLLQFVRCVIISLNSDDFQQRRSDFA
ncbi:hypothetical protein DSOL_5178 [Desulfosporosinus metallidurans]|uniref:Uncharacterized protein n=1 Tax=Desulfosporosinus metallidurans TaxID=1888891 RepID=A0A1Q8QF09_9FIRM|nr:hypothetical protein DSOL_5178 [Desulfosporosinus metallidurans]